MRRDDLRASRDKIVRQSHALPIAVVERGLLVGDPGSVLNGRWDRVPKLADQVSFAVPCAVYISSWRQGGGVWCVYGRVVVHDGGVVDSMQWWCSGAADAIIASTCAHGVDAQAAIVYPARRDARAIVRVVPLLPRLATRPRRACTPRHFSHTRTRTPS